MAVASGQEPVVNAMKQILQKGGSAADAIVAGMTSLWAVNPILLSATGAGYFMVNDGSGTFVVDAMASHPFCNRDRDGPITLEIGMGNAHQSFHFGKSVSAPSCLLKALIFLHQKYGKLPWKSLFDPVVQILEEGVEINDYRKLLIGIFESVIDEFPTFKKLYSKENGELLGLGDRMHNPKLLEFFKKLSETPDHNILRECYQEIELDFEDIDFQILEPLKIHFRGKEVLLVPPPNAGGILVAHSLQELEEQLSERDSEDFRQELIMKTLEKTMTLRRERVDGNLYDGTITESILGNTEHFSVVDNYGLAISATASNGTGSAVVCKDSGILMNNLLGEDDLNPKGFLGEEPGRRLPSMMTPCMVLEEGRLAYLVGSSGSERIRASIVNVLVNLIVDNMSVEEAVEKRRIHFDGEKHHIETEVSEDLKEAIGKEIRVWNRSFFFGGCHVVGSCENSWKAKGDPRRDGQHFVL